MHYQKKPKLASWNMFSPTPVVLQSPGSQMMLEERVRVVLWKLTEAPLSVQHG